MFPILTFLSFLKSEATTHTHFQPPHRCCVHIPSLLGVGLLNQKLLEDFSFQGQFFNSQHQKIREKKEHCRRNPGCNTCSSSIASGSVLALTLLYVAQERANYAKFPSPAISSLHRKTLVGKRREHQVPLPAKQVSTEAVFSFSPCMVPQRRAAGSGG